jgi:hypothetical protein
MFRLRSLAGVQGGYSNYAESPCTTTPARHWKESSKEHLVIHADPHPADRWTTVAVLGIAQLISPVAIN